MGQNQARADLAGVRTDWKTQVTQCYGGDLYEVHFFNHRTKCFLGNLRAKVRESMLYDFITNRRKYERVLHTPEFVEAVRLATQTIMDVGAYTSARIKKVKNDYQEHREKQADSPKKKKKLSSKT